MYAKSEAIEVIVKTPMSSIPLTSPLSTATIDTAVITSKLKAAEPTIVEGPNSPGV